MKNTPLYIQGMSAITTHGRGLEKFRLALKSKERCKPICSEKGHNAHRIQKEELTDKVVLKKARRADRFSRLAILTAYDALEDSKITNKEIESSKIGIILNTALGAHSTIFSFLDGIIDYGETKVSPTTFAHSIHNAAASYIASVLGTKGPVITVTQFSFSFQQSLMLARCWLLEGRVDKVLVGVADECSTTMEYICHEKIKNSNNEKEHALKGEDSLGFVPGEGSAFFLLSLEPSDKKYASFEDVSFGDMNKSEDECNLRILGTNGMHGSEKQYEKYLGKSSLALTFSHIYGGLMTGDAFDCVIAAMMLKEQDVFGVASSSRPGKMVKNGENDVAPLQRIQCIGHDCNQNLTFTNIQK